MGQISIATRDELVVALGGRYASSSRKYRGRILDEFAALSGLHRKHAMRLLRVGQPGGRSGLGVTTRFVQNRTLSQPHDSLPQALISVEMFIAEA